VPLDARRRSCGWVKAVFFGNAMRGSGTRLLTKLSNLKRVLEKLLREARSLTL